jgi:hypothetical protein
MSKEELKLEINRRLSNVLSKAGMSAVEEIAIEYSNAQNALLLEEIKGLKEQLDKFLSNAVSKYMRDEF